MTVQELLVYVGMLSILYLVVTTIPGRRRLVRWKREARREETRTIWAEARAQLFDLVRAGEISPQSETFRAFYHIQTFVLRRPDAYEEVAEEIASSLLAKSPRANAPPWVDEVGGWPRQMDDVVQKTAVGIGHLLIVHHGWRKFVLPVAKRLPRALYRRVLRFAHWCLERGIPWLRTDQELISAKRQVIRFASRANERPSHQQELSAVT